MTGPEHYREAEAMLLLVREEGDTDIDAEWVNALLLTAQAHATLALAAASASYGMFRTPAGHDESWAEVLSS